MCSRENQYILILLAGSCAAVWKFDIITKMFIDKECDRYVSRFNGSFGEDFESWSARLTAALEKKGLSAKSESRENRDDAASPEKS